MAKKNSNTLMLITGLVAGAATVYFLKSEKGKKIIDLTLSKSEELMEASQHILEEGKSTLGEVVNHSKEKIETTIKEVKNISESKLDQFNKGIEKAKNQISKA